MASDKIDPPQSDARRRRRMLGGIVGGVVVLIVVAVVVVLVAVHPASTGTSSAADAIAPTAGPGEVLTPTTGPAVATGSPVASDPAQPDVLPAVPLTATASPVTGLAVSITSLTAVDPTGNGVGEVSGPALQFTVTAVNNSADTISLATTVVGVTYGDALTPASEVGSAETLLPTEVSAGATATGTYVFTIPADQRSNVQISVDYQAGTPVAVFAGATP